MSVDTAPRGILFVLSGPSGVGKDTVLRAALRRLEGVRVSISATTRPPRPGERHGLDYFFISPEEFQRMEAEGDLLEGAVVAGRRYGTPRAWVEEQLRAGADVVLEIDVQGALQVKSRFPRAVLIFVAAPSWEELARRLRGRGTEDETAIRRRLELAHAEMRQAEDYDYLVVNDAVDNAADRLRAIVIAERLRSWRQHLPALLEGGPSNG